jgi:hypothetical protein
VVAGAIALIAVAYLAGRWGAEAAYEEARASSSVVPEQHYAPPSAPASAAARSARPAVAIPAPEAPAPIAAPPTPSPAQQARQVAQVNTTFKLEGLRRDMLARCWPSGGLGEGKQAGLRFAITFDENGREIARGISEDRRAPGGEFVRCLRGVPLGTFNIPAPGTRVAVNVPMTFP